LGILSETDFYGALPEIPGALEAVTAMDAVGIEVRFCTSPHQHPIPCVAEKYTWIAERLGFEWLTRVIVTNDKSLVAGDVLIDDRPDITGLRMPTWTHVVFDAPTTVTWAACAWPAGRMGRTIAHCSNYESVRNHIRGATGRTDHRRCRLVTGVSPNRGTV